MIMPAPMQPILRLRVRTGASGSKRSVVTVSAIGKSSQCRPASRSRQEAY